jgi:hypothetical protein
MQDFNKRLTDATASLTNVPQGIKLAQTRFEATRGSVADLGAPQLSDFVTGGSINISQLTLHAENLEDLLEKLNELKRRQNAGLHGNPGFA